MLNTVFGLRRLNNASLPFGHGRPSHHAAPRRAAGAPAQVLSVSGSDVAGSNLGLNTESPSPTEDPEFKLPKMTSLVIMQAASAMMQVTYSCILPFLLAEIKLGV